MWRRKGRSVIAFCVSAILLSSTASAGDAGAQDPKQTFRRPTEIPYLRESPPTPAKQLLGKVLFFDTRLSGSGLVSCATCHSPGLAWQDGLPHTIGHDGHRFPRQAPTLLNLAWVANLNWDGKKEELENQALAPFANPAIMGTKPEDATAKVAAIRGYRPLFKAAFGDEAVSFTRIAQALGGFERSLVSGEAPFDRWIAGDISAIDASAQRGFDLFTGKAHCSACHSGWRLTDDGFHDIGLPDADLGRGKLFPDEPSLEHTFKTPTLRNIDQRAPYMHDGSIASLSDVVAHYDIGFVQRPSLSPDVYRLGLTAAERSDIMAFLHSLSSQDPVITYPILPPKDTD